MTSPTQSDDISPSNLQRFVWNGIVFDQVNGHGAVHDVSKIEYMGFVAFMRPSVFLELCPPEGLRPELYLDRVQIEPISMGFLVVDLEETPPRIRGHEGRHRMRAIQTVHGDEPAPVAFLFSHGDRARDVTRDHIYALSRGIRRQRSTTNPAMTMLEGPLFERVFLCGEDLMLNEPSPAP